VLPRTTFEDWGQIDDILAISVAVAFVVSQTEPETLKLLRCPFLKCRKP